MMVVTGRNWERTDKVDERYRTAQASPPSAQPQIKNTSTCGELIPLDTPPL
jgi:hypothetical protein